MAEERKMQRQPEQGIWEEIHRRIDSLTREMEGDLTEEDLRDLWYRRALELSRSGGAVGEEARKMKVVVFRLGSDRYGVGIDGVRERCPPTRHQALQRR